MEITYKEWKKDMVYEGNHKGYDFVIKDYLDGHYVAYIKIPNNHKYYGLDYEDIDIKARNSITFSEKIEDDWWIGWDYGCIGWESFNKNNDKKYGLIPIFMDCCYVIKQLIDKEDENGISDIQSTISKEISDHINNINAKKQDIGIEIDISNKCIICGKPTISEAKSEQITNIHRKKTNIDKEIDRTFTPDPQKAMKLINKVNRYEREIRKIENQDLDKYICDNCRSELLMKDIIELLKLFRKHRLMAKLIADTFHRYFSRYRSGDYVEDDYEGEDYDIYEETMINIQDNLNDKKLYEYYKAKLLFILKYYDKALVSFQNLLDNHEQIKEYDIREYGVCGEELTEEELNHYGEREQLKNEIINSIPEEINKIKEILGID